MSAITSKSYWGNLIPDDTESPATVLRKQAEALTRQTKGLLEGRVVSTGLLPDTAGKNPMITMKLVVRVPSLNDYVLGICEVRYPVSMRAIILVDIINEKKTGHPTLDRFEAALRDCLSSQGVRRILSSLLQTASATVGS